MPEALRGKLDQLSLSDVLNMLAGGKKTGCLHVKNGIDQGEIFLDNGVVVHALASPHQGEAALNTVTTWLGGDFAFEPNVVSPDTTISIPMDSILRNVDKTIEEYRQIREVIPSNDVTFRFSTKGASDEVSLRPQEWQVLSQIDGSRTVDDIAGGVGMDSFSTLKLLTHLVRTGLVQVAERSGPGSAKKIDVSFFDKLTSEFTELMGPIGPIIIEDEIEAMGMTMENFLRIRVAELVERVSASIENETKRIQFQRIMLDLLRAL